MSGDHFDHPYHRISDIIEEIEELIENNDRTDLNEWGDPVGFQYGPETIEKFRLAVELLKRAAIAEHRIDYLVSGDDGEESFRERWDKEIGR